MPTCSIRLLFTITFLMAVPAFAQQSLFQSASGDTSIFLPGGSGVASYNLGSDTARFDFERDRGGRWALGGGTGGTVKAGAGSIINKNSPATGGFVEGGGLYRLHGSLPQECTTVQDSDPDLTVVGAKKLPAGCSNRNHFEYVIGQFHYGFSQFNTLASDAVPLATPTKVNFNDFRGTLAINGIVNRDSATLHYGAAYVTETTNNLPDLKQETYQTESISTAAGIQTTDSPMSKSVYVGAYKTHIGQEINGDFVVQPSKTFAYQLGFDVMLRADFAGGPGVRYISPGLGIYFFKKGSPVVPVAGIAYSYRAGNSQVSIVTGWTFGGTSASK